MRLLFPLLVSFTHASLIEHLTGRVIVPIESFNISDPTFSEIMLMQNKTDEINKEFTAKIESEYLWKEETSLGPITLGECLHSGQMSTVWTIVEHDDWLIKYQADCEYEVKPHPLIRDYWFTNKANEENNLAPRAHFLSPPSRLCDKQDGKCGFGMSNATFADCKAFNRTMRYMIMDRADGLSLHDFRLKLFGKTKGAIGLRNGAVIGSKLISLIRDLHLKAKIIHGDIHTPNVMISVDPVSNSSQLQLIDFGNAFTKAIKSLPETRIHSPGKYFHEFFTVWQMSGYAWSARDDILKAIQSIAHIIQPFSFFAYEKQIKARGSRALVDWKMNGNWFVNSHYDPVDNIPGIPIYVREQLYRLLDEILRIVRSLGINSVIPYEDIVKRFDRIAILCHTHSISP